MEFFDTLRDRARRRAAYIRTRDEIATMTLDVALDLDIDRSKAKDIARKAVYGA